MSLELRTITDDEIPAYRDAVITAFGDDSDGDPTGADRTRALISPEQLWAAFDDGAIVGTAATFDHAVALPGGAVLPMAGLTMVMVRPTHRRRGLASALMRLHLDDARRRGFAISGLWASESSIYGRFGYGIAAEGDELAVEHAHSLRLAQPYEPDELVWIDEARARRELPALYGRVFAERPGALARSEVWWRERRFLEAPFMRAGSSRRRFVLASRGGEVVGYLVYRQKPGFSDGLPAGKLEINELIAVDPRAEATLWQFALRVDLFPKVTWWNAPTDTLLPWLAMDPRRVHRRRTDTLWLRLEDVPAALAARGYADDGALRLAVDETVCELVVEAGRARCAASTRDPELRLGRPAIASLFLGAVPASRLARAGLVHGDPAAIARADRMFASPIAPWCPEVF